MLRKFFLGFAMVCAVSQPFLYGPRLWRNEKYEDAFWIIWALAIYGLICFLYLKQYWEGFGDE